MMTENEEQELLETLKRFLLYITEATSTPDCDYIDAECFCSPTEECLFCQTRRILLAHGIEPDNIQKEPRLEHEVSVIQKALSTKEINTNKPHQEWCRSLKYSEVRSNGKPFCDCGAIY